MFLGLDGLAEDRIPAVILLFHRSGSFFDVVECLRLYGCCMRNDRFLCWVHLQEGIAARTGDLERWSRFRHCANDIANRHLAGRQLERQDFEHMQHFPAQENDRHDRHHNRERFTEAQP